MEQRQKEPEQAPGAAQEVEAATVEEGKDTPEVVDERAQLQQELAQVQDKLLRQAAEFQNYRRRTSQERDNLVNLGKSLVVQQMLDVLDDLQRSIEAAEQMEAQAEGGEAYHSLKQGVDLV